MTKIILGISVALLIGYVVYTKKDQETVIDFVDQTIESDQEKQQDVSHNQALDLSNQGLTQVPATTFTNSTLEELNVSHNQLTGALPAEVRHLSSLRVLDVSHNQLTGVPAEIGQLSELRILDLSHNQLTGLPLELGNLSQLHTLDLRGNAYAEADLAQIKAALPPTTEILID